MECPHCRHQNRPESRFCEACGGALTQACPACGASNRLQARFCDQCGTPLQRSALSDLPASPAQLAIDFPRVERRQLTVMFSDLVGSTALSERLDPEELRELIRAYQAVCVEAIDQWRGQVHQYLGDGILAFFGYPQAYEDDALRAIRAGLGILAGMERLNDQLQADQGEKLSVRIGIHTGLVVVGELSGALQVLGETTNLASRLQGEAEAGTLVISQATCDLVKGMVECRFLGPRRLKGISRPVEVFQVLGERDVNSRLEATLLRGAHPLVGRDPEMRQLRESWRSAALGGGSQILLYGEAGIGKSRLVYTLKQQVGLYPGARILEVRCLPHYQHTPFYPIVDLLRHQIFAFDRDADEELGEKWRRVTQWANRHGLESPLVYPVLSPLLALPLPPGASRPALAPEKQKEATMQVLRQFFRSLAHAGSVLWIVEDLQWADSATTEFLQTLSETGPLPNMMILLTSRPESAPDWSTFPNLTMLRLQRLAEAEVQSLVAGITGGKALPPQVLGAIAERTDGVPLFVEELTQMALESDWIREENEQYVLTRPLPALAIPSTLQDSLMARLDRLAGGKELAQLAATIGREFSFDLLAALAEVEESTLSAGLNDLVEAGLIYTSPPLPKGNYLFKHALIRDAAYQSLLRRDRQRYHGRIAQLLETRFAERSLVEPELLAFHYTEAAMPEKAVHFWTAAGRQAAGCCVNEEAISHLEKGLALLKGLPPSPQRRKQELDILLALGPLKGALRGFAAPEVEALYDRAWKICQHLTDTAHLAPVLWALYFFYFSRAEHRLALKIGHRLLSLARQEGDPMALIQGHFIAGSTWLELGALGDAKKELDQGAYLFDPRVHRYPVHSVDPGFGLLFALAKALMLQGFPEQAWETARRAQQVVAKGDHTLSRLDAFQARTILAWMSRRFPEMLDSAEALIGLARQKTFPDVERIGQIWKGAALVYLGQGPAGRALLQEYLTYQERAGTERGLTVLYLLAAETNSLLSLTEAGRSVWGKAQLLLEKTEEAMVEPELYRINGVLISLEGGPTTAVEAAYRQAAESARRQGNRLWELRALIALARHLQQQDRHEEAFSQLEHCRLWFTEGEAFPDLREADVLLEELGAGLTRTSER